jgi:hypothetical protein
LVTPCGPLGEEGTITICQQCRTGASSRRSCRSQGTGDRRDISWRVCRPRPGILSLAG